MTLWFLRQLKHSLYDNGRKNIGEIIKYIGRTVELIFSTNEIISIMQRCELDS